MPDFKLEKFEGPLDFLLQLLDEQKLNISEIALSQVTEQFFSYLDKLEENRSEELADFLVIAARLIYTKSHHLLNYLYPEEEESGPSLADQLKMYKKYIEASKDINRLWSAGRIAYGRIEPPIKIKEFVLPINTQLTNLHSAMTALVSRLKPLQPLPQVTIDHTISIKQKIDSIRELLRNTKQFNFSEMLAGAKNKTEIIANFLAILELIKDKFVFIKQDQAFADLIIKKV
ncbi:MAG: segregation/condensation protein A [Patescibacteria group bacterium]